MIVHDVPLGGKNVPYLSGVDITADITDAWLSGLPDCDLAVVVLDRSAANHAAPVVDELSKHVQVVTVTVDAGEPRKTLALVERIAEHAVEHGATRRSAVVGIGGGMVGNVAGLAASLLFRGIRLVHLPTTPIAAFDSVLSIKQAVNLRGGKNLIGTYHPPTLIACDLRWIASVPDSQLLTGLAEMAKNVLAVVPDRLSDFHQALGMRQEAPMSALAELLEIGRSAKEPFLASDPRERREALIFEYGHTLGHALEFGSGGTMNHGEAVAWGMLAAAEVSRALGHLDDAGVRAHADTVAPLGLGPAPAWMTAGDGDGVRAVLIHDNKRGYLDAPVDTVPMVLLESLGVPVIGERGFPLIPVPVDMAMEALRAVVSAAADRAREAELVP